MSSTGSCNSDGSLPRHHATQHMADHSAVLPVGEYSPSSPPYLSSRLHAYQRGPAASRRSNPANVKAIQSECWRPTDPVGRLRNASHPVNHARRRRGPTLTGAGSRRWRLPPYTCSPVRRRLIVRNTGTAAATEASGLPPGPGTPRRCPSRARHSARGPVRQLPRVFADAMNEQAGDDR